LNHVQHNVMRRTARIRFRSGLHFAQKIAMWSGHPVAFLLAVIVIAVWIVTGPISTYSDTWQLVINTGTTIVTF